MKRDIELVNYIDQLLATREGTYGDKLNKVLQFRSEMKLGGLTVLEECSTEDVAHDILVMLRAHANGDVKISEKCTL